MIISFCTRLKGSQYRCFLSPLLGIVITRLPVVTRWDYLRTRGCHFILLRPMACLIQALFICSHRFPFLTHSTLMAPFTPLSAPSPGSTMNTSLSPCLPDRLLSVEKPTARRKPFVTYLRGGWMAPSFDLYLAIFFSSLTLYISLSHFSDVTKVIRCPCYWIPYSFLNIVQGSRTPGRPSLSKAVMNSVSTDFSHSVLHSSHSITSCCKNNFELN